MLCCAFASPRARGRQYGDGLGGATVVSSGDVRATGDEGTSRFDSVPLAERWNGHHWSIVSTPSPTGDDLLDGAAVLSAHDIWAVGASGFNRTFVLRWTG